MGISEACVAILGSKFNWQTPVVLVEVVKAETLDLVVSILLLGSHVHLNSALAVETLDGDTAPMKTCLILASFLELHEQHCWDFRLHTETMCTPFS